MLSSMRNNLSKWVVGLIVGFIIFVFVFEFGIRSQAPGSSGSGFAGSVNGKPISVSQFKRELARRMEFFKQLGGGNFTEEQLNAFGIKAAVFRDLVQKQIMIEEAEKIRLLPSEAQIKDQILKYDAFKKDGQFDPTQYRQVLEANQMTPGTFEKLVSEDLVTEVWKDHFKKLVRFTESEIKNEFIMANTKREVKYVFISPEVAKKFIKVTDSEIKKYLEDEKQFNLLKSKYETGKETAYKGKSLAQVRDEIATNLIASNKMDEIKKISESLADQVLSAMKKNANADTAVASILKPANQKLTTSKLLARSQFTLPGVGQVKDLQTEVFMSPSPLDPKKGGSPKKYFAQGGYVVAVVVQSEEADLARLDEKERESFISKIITRKESALFNEWIKKLTEKAKIVQNPEVVSS